MNIMIKLSPNTTFSSAIYKANKRLRLQKTDEMNDIIFNEVLSLYSGRNSCGIGAIKSRYNQILPERKNVNVSPLPKSYYEVCGGSTNVDYYDGEISGYTIEMPVSGKRKLNILDFPQFMHESTHVLDYLLNPKYIANLRDMWAKNIFDKDYFRVYGEYFDNTDEIMQKSSKEFLQKAEEELRKKIKDVPHKEKMVFLKYIKYHLQMEEHAYEQELKFARQMKKLGKPVDAESLEDYSKMQFRQKTDIINSIIHDEMMSEKLRKIG